MLSMGIVKKELNLFANERNKYIKNHINNQKEDAEFYKVRVELHNSDTNLKKYYENEYKKTLEEITLLEKNLDSYNNAATQNYKNYLLIEDNETKNKYGLKYKESLLKDIKGDISFNDFILKCSQ